jgi:hypothetical protein
MEFDVSGGIPQYKNDIAREQNFELWKQGGVSKHRDKSGSSCMTLGTGKVILFQVQ